MLLEELVESVSATKSRQINQVILDKLIPGFEKFMDENQDNEMLILSHIIDSLNKEFGHMDIIFSLGDIPNDEYVSTGETDVSNGEIDILVDRESIFSGQNSLYSDSEFWAKSLSTTISHEILHRKQIRKSKGRIQGSNLHSDSEYLANKHEIQAHAKDAVDFIAKFSSIHSREDVLKYLKNNLEDAKVEIEPIRNYWETFGETDLKVWKRFLKYVMFYANEYI